MLTRPDDPDRPWANHPFYRGMSDQAAAPSWAARERQRLEDEAWEHKNGPQKDDWQSPNDIPDERGEISHDPTSPSDDTPTESTLLPPLTVNEWRERNLAEPDFLMGNWLTTTSRVLVTAATGLGKSNLGIALAMRVAAGAGFLHWEGRRSARVLYIDGEMSSRLLKQRLLDEAQRAGQDPAGFYGLSHEDIPNFKPLNTPEGQACIEKIIKSIGGVDLLMADSVMCLLAGDMKDEEPWNQTMPWIRSLTKRSIGQLWLHHTGHDETKGYGTKTREWQMDTVLHLETARRDDTDVSFNLTFRKARERTPATRFDFQDVRVALVNDRWEHAVNESIRPASVPPMGLKFLAALVNVAAGSGCTVLSGNRRGASSELWQAECTQRGLIDPKAKPGSARALFSKYRSLLVAANRIACEGDFSWLIA